MLLTSITSAIMVTFFITWLFVKFVDFYLNIRLSSAICSLVLRHNTPVKFLNGVVFYNNFRIIFPIPLLYRALSSVCFWYLEAWLAGQRKQGSEDCREERHRWEGETHAKSGKWISKRIMGRQLSPIGEPWRNEKSSIGYLLPLFLHNKEPPASLLPTRRSWCKWQRDQVTGKKTFVPNPLPWPVLKRIELVFERLASVEILEKCLDGFTQNQNEALHGSGK